MKRLSIRLKMTLWYGAVLAIVLLAFGAVVYLTMRHQLLSRIDQGLDEELADVLYEVKRANDPKSLSEWLDRRFARHEGFDFQITRPSGERFFVSARLADQSLSIPAPATVTETPHYESASAADSKRWRIVTVRVTGPDGPLTVQIARSLEPFDHESRELLATLLLVGPLTLLVAVGGGYFLARRALAPVQRMTQAANQITADRLSQRIDIANPDDELGALAGTLNRMIERLERSFTEMQRFTADAAHELRTPLAIIRAEAEVALRSQRSPEEYAHVLENLLEETERLSSLADQLLFLCRQDAGLHPAAREPVAMDDLLRDVVNNMQLVGQEKGVTVSLAENAACTLVADSRQLRRVFYNLLDNAIKYTDSPGQVTVRSIVTAEGLEVAVADTGIGIPPEHLPRVFDRFYRVDPARTESNAAGLGLSICQSIIHSLAGRITVASTVGKGTTVVVVLPKPFA